MNTERESQYDLDYRRIETAILFLRDAQTNQPSLEDVAAHVGMSAFHFQRLFSRWAGISPKKFLQFLTLQHAKILLEDARLSVLQAAIRTGLSGSGRLHDLFVKLEAMTPGEYKEKGKGLLIRYGVHSTPFGRAIICTTDKGICGLTFLAAESEQTALDYQQRRWPLSEFIEDTKATGEYSRRVFHQDKGESVECLVIGTDFQCQVWEALLNIPSGSVTTYAAIAKAVDRPRSARAAANAIGANPIAVLIPCHRVIRSTGALGGYRWGAPRKQAMLARESAKKILRHIDEGFLLSGSEAYQFSPSTSK